MDHVSITDSHLWSNVTVEDNVTISQSILCSDCIIKKGAVIPKGCIIGRGCVIGTNVHLPEFSRITMYQNDEFDEFGDDDLGQADEDDEDEEIITINEDELDQLEAEESSVDSDKSHSVEGVEFTGCVTGETNHSDQTIVGPDGYGLLWVPGENDIDFNDDLDQIVSDLEQPSADGTNALTHPYLKVISAGVFERIKQQSIGYDPSTMLNKRKLLQEEGDEGYISDDNAMDDEEFEENMDVGDRSNLSSVLSSSNLTGDGVLITGRQRGIDVVKELTSICLEHDDSSPIENLAIELNSFKFSQNATFGDCVTGKA
jgi:translation initiation factor eIF-2B subunit epsilon